MLNSTHYLFDSFDINKPSNSKFSFMKNSIINGAIILFLSFMFQTSFVNAQNVERQLNDKASVRESSVVDIRTHSERDMRIPKPANSDVLSNQSGRVEDSRPGSSIELIDKRTEFSRTMKNIDGSFSRHQSSFPMHYKENNKWVPIKTEIKPSELGPYAYSNLTNTFKTYFPENLSNGFLTKINDKQVQDMLFGLFYSSEGESVFSFNNSTAALGGDINTISYPLSSDFRIDVKVKNAERKVDYVIESPNFLNQFSGEFFVIEEQMKLPIGWKLLERNGSIDIVNEENIMVASIGEIIYYDTNRSKENNGGIQRKHYEFDLLENGNYVLKAKISLSWLNDPQRQFPIVIDPSISASNTDTYNNGYYWTDNGGNNRHLTTTGASAGSGITSVDFTVSGEVSYYGGSCNSWWTYQITSAGSNVASGCNGSSFPTTFDGENPNQTWTVTATDLDGYTDYLGYQFTIVVNYDEPVVGQPPVANFSASTTTPYLNQTVSLTDLSTNAPTGWTWAFNPNTVTYTSGTSTSQSPTVRFDAAGTYDVSLNAQNANGDDDEIKVSYISMSSDCIIPSSGSSSATTCSGNLYDSEGSSSAYASSSDGYITIYPGTPGQKVNISGSITTESYYDYFYVYDGENTSATDLTGGGVSGSGVAVNYTSTHSTGALTIRLTSDGSVQYAGVDVAISCVTPCSGTPGTPTAAITSATDFCSGSQATIAATDYSIGSGISYDWEASLDGASWSSAAIGNATIYSTSDNYQWRYKTTCSYSGLSSYSNTVTKSVATATAGSDVTQCGMATASLSATTNMGSVEWYAASSGGTVLTTGNSYTPSVSTTITYYAASSECPSNRSAIIVTVDAPPDAGTLSGTEDVCSDGSTTFTSDGGSGTWSSGNTNVATINSSTGVITPVSSGSSVITYTVSGAGACAGSADETATRTVSINAAPNAGTVAVTDLSVSGNADLTEAIEADAITWTNSGTANGTIQYYYEWTNNSGTSPTGAWNSWTTSNPNVWNANSSGGNMNRTLWVKTVTTSTNGCGTAESGTTWIDVRNCRAAATGATVSAGTVANMPFGETITYTATMDDGAFERFQYQWQGTGGAWSDWSTTNPLAYATDINAGQTLYVRSKIIGPSTGTQTCTDYSDPVQTFLIDCANTVSADAGTDNTVCNGSSVVLSGSGTGSAVTGYSWSPATELSSTSIAGPTSTATSTRTYTLTTTHTDGCIATDAVVVTVNEVPINSNVAISSNSTPPRNNDDITATISTSDPESSTVYSENDWRVDGSSFAVQNLSFDANGSDGLTSHSSQGGSLTAYGDATQVAGVKGQAYEFDGNGDYLQNSSLNIDPTQGLSVSLWTYTESLGSGAQRWFNLGGDGSGELFVLRKTSSNTVEGYIKTGGNHSNWCSGCSSGDFIYLNGQVTTGSNNTGWQHWVMTWDGQTSNGQMKLYLDGSLIHTTITSAGGLIPVTSLNINQNSSPGWNGKIDELLIFERDISSDQVTALYNSGTPSYSTITNDETSCGESWTLLSTPVDDPGCSGSTTTSTVVSISGAQVTTADVTDVTTCGLDNHAIAIDDANDVGVWEVSPVNAALIDDPSAPSTTVTASPVPNPTSGFNSDLTFTWVPTDNNCTSDNVTIKFNQPVVTGTMDNYCWAWGGGTNSNWSTGSNWYKWDGSKWEIQSASYPDAGSKVYILPSSETCVTNGAINASASLEDLNIQGGSFDLGSANTSITGDIINNGGTLLSGSGTVTFNGSGAQSITGSGVNTNFNNLIINNSNGISSDIQLVVENELTMISGNIDNSSPLVLGSSSANSGILNHTTGIITGEFRRYFPNATGSQMFPVGTSSIMRDVSVNFTSAPGTDQYLTASYVTGAPTLFGGGDYAGLPLVTEDGQLIQNYDNEGHWVINPTNDDYNSSINGKAYTISMHMNNISDATDYTKTRIIKSAGSNTASQHHLSWAALTGQSVSGYNGAAPSNSNFAVTATSTGFSLFGAGSDDGDPLPVELVSFTGNCADGVVDVTWTTASEYNSSHFELENSRDGITWDVVYTKDAAGQSTELTEYTYNDVHANGGDNYYRLTQVDIDGTSKTYDVINVSCSQTTSGYFSIFPNPSSGSFQVILNNAEIIGDARMNVVDTKGNIVLSKPLDVKSGINMYIVNEDFAPGIYYVSVENGDKVTVVLKHSVK